MAQQMVTNFNGILLFRRDYRERDMLIKFLTAEYGAVVFAAAFAVLVGLVLFAPKIWNLIVSWLN